MTHKYSFELISKLISGYFNIDPALLYTNTSKKEVVEARRVAIYFSRKFIREKTKGYKNRPTLKKIAKHFNLKDHSTIIYHIKRVKQLKKIYKSYDSDIRKIDTHLKSGNIDYFKKNLPEL